MTPAMAAWARLLLVGVGLVGLNTIQADSLWLRRDPRFAEMFQDTRARRVGDLLTIVVRENTDIEHKEQRDMKKKTNSAAKFNLAGSVAGDVSSNKISGSLDASGSTNKELDAKSDYLSDRRFIDRMTVVVVDVLPNGNLIIEGHRKRVVSGEVRMLKMRGIVWPNHIGPYNTVQSQYIGNFEVYYIGKGAETSATSHGFFGKCMHKLWPF